MRVILLDIVSANAHAHARLLQAKRRIVLTLPCAVTLDRGTSLASEKPVMDFSNFRELKKTGLQEAHSLTVQASTRLARNRVNPHATSMAA